jgi:hypothetical protein
LAAVTRLAQMQNLSIQRAERLPNAICGTPKLGGASNPKILMKSTRIIDIS